MKFWINTTGRTIELSAGDSLPSRLVCDPSANQTAPRRCYVYAHADSAGRYFYVGKGSGNRAWSRDRERLWHRHLDKHLGGVYSVVILVDDLSTDEAEDVESQWIGQENDGLVNLQNMARRVDLQALNRRDSLMSQNRKLIEQARSLEESDAPQAISLYQQAMELLHAFAPIQVETGLFGRLRAEEEEEENGPMGQISLLDRLTLCLVRAGRSAEADTIATEYFETFRGDRTQKKAESILLRITKAKMKLVNDTHAPLPAQLRLS